MKITVIGGANTDICGAPGGKLLLKDSNPGKVSISLGGVGRNIAHDLTIIGAEVKFVTAVGDDLFSGNILQSCKELGMDVSRTLTVSGRRSSTYLYVTDESGDMHVGISDMDIVGCITPEYISSISDYINDADAIVIDANLSAETIDRIAETAKIPVYADPVSTAKAVRLSGILGRLEMMKPNRYEAEKLTGEQDPARAAEALVKAGVKKAFISCGEKGMTAADKTGTYICAAELVASVNTNGAGDAATAAIVYASLLGRSPIECMKAAARAGAITVQSTETNCKGLTREALGL